MRLRCGCFRCGHDRHRNQLAFIYRCSLRNDYAKSGLILRRFAAPDNSSYLSIIMPILERTLRCTFSPEIEALQIGKTILEGVSCSYGESLSCGRFIRELERTLEKFILLKH